MKKILVLICALTMLSTVWASGTSYGTSINAAAVNILLSYSDGAGGTATKDATADLIPDWEQAVEFIDGLVFDSNSAGASGMAVGTNYPFSISVLNRGNRDVAVDLTGSVDGTGANWSVAYDVSTNIVEDTLGTLVATVNPQTGVTAFEKATLNVTATIAMDPKNVVSYNVFAGAVTSGSYLDAGVYGGDDNLTAAFAMEAQGYSLTVTNRAAAISTSGLPGYTGTVNAAVPGAKIKYTITVNNGSSSVATGVTIKDAIPANTHLYYQDNPTGAPTYTDQSGSTPLDNNSNATATEIQFQGIDIAAGADAVVEYTVTID